MFFAVKRFYFLLRPALVIIAAAAAFATRRLLLFIAGFHFFRRFLLAGIARFRILLLRLATVTTIIVAALAAVTSGTVITGVAAFVTIATVVLPWLATILLTLRFSSAFGAAVSTAFVSSPLNSCFSALRKRLNRPGWAGCAAATLSFSPWRR